LAFLVIYLFMGDLIVNKNKKQQSLIILFLALLFSSIFTVQTAYAHPNFLTLFGAKYPASDTDNVGCQTCHEGAGGGEPWNQYGRDLLANGASGLGQNGDITPILEAIEFLNSDAIAGNNITEIDAGTQPGWCEIETSGCVNNTYNSNGSEAGIGVPPAAELDDEPVVVSEPNIQVTQASVDFGEVLLGESASADVNISNVGDLDLTLEALISGAPFAITVVPDAVVTPMGMTVVTLSYTPVVEGSDAGSLTLNSNDPDSPSIVLSLSGTGAIEPPDLTGICPVGNELVDPIPDPIAQGAMEVALETIADGFVNPVLGLSPDRDNSSFYVADQPGQLWRISLRNGQKYVFLDLSDRLVELGLFGINYDERGFLGAAFAPNFARSGLLYTYTSEPANAAADFSTMPDGVDPDHQSVVTEWQVDVPLTRNSVVDPASARVIMRIDQPQFNHNGGTLAFGPDRKLYITLGDGGGADDQGDAGDNVGHSEMGNGQDTSNVLGSILRIDTRGNNAPNGQYGIPEDNPFVDADDFAAGDVGGEAGCVDGICDEIYAYGFRNAWRASFDRSRNGVLMVADVGQNDIEEVDVVKAGGNYGWRIQDGSYCFDANGTGSGFVTDAEFVGPPDIIDPVAEYDHDEGISISGGFVYRGRAIPALRGHYVFGDWAPSFTEPLPGRLFYLADSGLDGTSGVTSEILEFQLPNSTNGVGTKINGFGQDASGEVYIIGSEFGLLEGTTGKVQKIVPVN
jgi:glucose/arabinose dehydrogenase